MKNVVMLVILFQLLVPHACYAQQTVGAIQKMELRLKAKVRAKQMLLESPTDGVVFSCPEVAAIVPANTGESIVVQSDSIEKVIRKKLISISQITEALEHFHFHSLDDEDINEFLEDVVLLLNRQRKPTSEQVALIARFNIKYGEKRREMGREIFRSLPHVFEGADSFDLIRLHEKLQQSESDLMLQVKSRLPEKLGSKPGIEADIKNMALDLIHKSLEREYSIDPVGLGRGKLPPNSPQLLMLGKIRLRLGRKSENGFVPKEPEHFQSVRNFRMYWKMILEKRLLNAEDQEFLSKTAFYKNKKHPLLEKKATEVNGKERHYQAIASMLTDKSFPEFECHLLAVSAFKSAYSKVQRDTSRNPEYERIWKPGVAATLSKKILTAATFNYRETIAEIERSAEERFGKKGGILDVERYEMFRDHLGSPLHKILSSRLHSTIIFTLPEPDFEDEDNRKYWSNFRGSEKDQKRLVDLLNYQIRPPLIDYSSETFWFHESSPNWLFSSEGYAKKVLPDIFLFGTTQAPVSESLNLHGYPVSPNLELKDLDDGNAYALAFKKEEYRVASYFSEQLSEKGDPNSWEYLFRSKMKLTGELELAMGELAEQYLKERRELYRELTRIVYDYSWGQFPLAQTAVIRNRLSKPNERVEAGDALVVVSEIGRREISFELDEKSEPLFEEVVEKQLPMTVSLSTKQLMFQLSPDQRLKLLSSPEKEKILRALEEIEHIAQTSVAYELRNATIADGKLTADVIVPTIVELPISGVPADLAISWGKLLKKIGIETNLKTDVLEISFPMGSIPFTLSCSAQIGLTKGAASELDWFKLFYTKDKEDN